MDCRIGKQDDAVKKIGTQVAKPWEGGATFSLGNRIVRLIWSTVWLLLASWTPPVCRGWRRWLLRLFGAKLHPTANVYGSARIWLPSNLNIEAHGAIGPRATIYCMAPIIIGRYAIVSQGAHLCAGTHDIEDSDFKLYARPIHIGERAWIAAEAFVGPGVTVGDGAVLGARGCAMRDLAAWTVYTGNPAAIKRQRFIRFPKDAKAPIDGMHAS